MKRLLLILFLALFMVLSQAQTGNDRIRYKSTTKQEISIGLSLGFALQTVGVGMTVGAVYLLEEYPDNPFVDALGSTGLGIAAAGSYLVISTFTDIAKATHLMHEQKKAQKHKNISLNIEQTQYGVGLVFRF